ncbi:hypothetical protein D1AOALGA4SA_9900 [Olavius algarvensis Delta 1 endosymbiont]|nr:hypothetical protein D1AOALGA4SA_9900 [Olavius algarvensis Delta 1 endosymbiont]
MPRGRARGRGRGRARARNVGCAYVILRRFGTISLFDLTGRLFGRRQG